MSEAFLKLSVLVLNVDDDFASAASFSVRSSCRSHVVVLGSEVYEINLNC